jgi:hypothetical protein
MNVVIQQGKLCDKHIVVFYDTRILLRIVKAPPAESIGPVLRDSPPSLFMSDYIFRSSRSRSNIVPTHQMEWPPFI